MSSALHQWLAGCGRAPGALGCGVQLPDHTSVSRSFSEGFPPSHLDEALRCLAEVAPVFSGHGLFPRWLTWSFESGQLRVAVRPDGAMFALAVQANSPAAGNLAAFTTEFFALKLTD